MKIGKEVNRCSKLLIINVSVNEPVFPQLHQNLEKVLYTSRSKKMVSFPFFCLSVLPLKGPNSLNIQYFIVYNDAIVEWPVFL